MPRSTRLSLWQGLEFGAPHGSTVEHEQFVAEAVRRIVAAPDRTS